MSENLPPPGVRRPGGAYGIAVEGVPAARALLVDAPAHWTRVELTVREPAPLPAGGETVNEGEAILALRSGGWVRVDRRAARAEFALPRPTSDAALVHPHLAAVAVVHAHWSARESFHAGAFVAADGVWAVLGTRGAGKSSLLATLARRGVPIVCDDVLVTDGRTVLAGPRSIDLRMEAAQQLGCGEALGRVGGRERWRLTLDPVPAELPFRGWVELRWGPAVTIGVRSGSERLQALVPHRGLRVAPRRPERLLDLASLPVLELARPTTWASHEDAIDALLDALPGGGQPGRL